VLKYTTYITDIIIMEQCGVKMGCEVIWQSRLSWCDQIGVENITYKQ